ncbi:MAG TPA: hypothetical protein VNL97_03240 [Solirubrobacterales bacterium]|nr:hypothetical protein [Solirubrobacterales bacterium]
MSEGSDVVERAMRYPYAVPAHAFAQLGHDTLSPDEVEIDRGERTPLLAYGSNGSPEVLARKLALSGDPVLVEPGWLYDFDVVYSAHISPYGAVPATLQRSVGTAVRVAVLHLTAEQLRLLSATEPNYEPTHLKGVRCELASGETETELSVYLSRHGCLLVDGAEAALVAVPARGRRFAELSEPQVLEHVRSTLCPQESIDAFVLSSVADPALAQAHSAQLPRRPLSLR